MQLLNKSDLYDYHKYNDEIKKKQRILKNYITTKFPSNEEIRDVYDILKEEGFETGYHKSDTALWIKWNKEEK